MKPFVKLGKTSNDLMVLDNYGITVRGSLFDTMIAHYLINGTASRYGLFGGNFAKLSHYSHRRVD